MIKVCISEKRFTQSLGYGLWGLLTVGLVVILVATTLEIPTVTGDQEHIDHRNANEKVCYQSVFYGEKCTTLYIWKTHTNLYKANMLFKVFFVIDVIVICLWVYHKQDRFKIGFCEKTGVTKE